MNSHSTEKEENTKLGLLQLDKCDYIAAIGSFTKAIDIEDNDAKDYENRGVAYLLASSHAVQFNIPPSSEIHNHIFLAFKDYTKALETDKHNINPIDVSYQFSK